MLNFFVPFSEFAFLLFLARLGLVSNPALLVFSECIEAVTTDSTTGKPKHAFFSPPTLAPSPGFSFPRMVPGFSF